MNKDEQVSVACFEDVNKAWEIVEEKHDLFGFVPEGDESVNAAEEWITGAQADFIAIRHSVFELRIRKENDNARSTAELFYQLYKKEIL